jgi:hypothetical protein
MAGSLFISNFNNTKIEAPMNKKTNSYLLFFLRLAIFIFTLFVLDGVTGSLLRHYYFTQNSGSMYHTTYSMESATNDIIIFGTSRATHHYKPEVFERMLGMTCYNAGKDGTQILYHYAVLESVLKRYTPKIIILDISLKEVLKSDENYDWLSSLLPYYKKHPEIRPVVDLKSYFEKYKLISSSYPFNSAILTIAKSNGITSAEKGEKGYLPLEKEWKEPLTTDIPRRPEKIDSVKLHYFEKFIEDCKKANTRLYVMFSPIYIRYDQPPVSLVTIKGICEHNHIPFYDYSKSIEFLSNPSLFQDRSHMNDKGATIYSEKVAREIKSSL